MPVAVGPWALDSGGFTEVTMHGGWRTTETEYIEFVAGVQQRIGRLVWAAPQDWMCEPVATKATGLTVHEHQRRTVENYCQLRQLAPTLPFVPVLQGWAVDDYFACIDMYVDAGIDLYAEPLVGLGSVCRRQAVDEISGLVQTLAGEGLRLHGFGIKTVGLRKYGKYLRSADSMAWSFRARRSEPLEGCAHRACNNCLKFALQWRDKVLLAMAGAA